MNEKQHTNGHKNDEDDVVDDNDDIHSMKSTNKYNIHQATIIIIIR